MRAFMGRQQHLGRHLELAELHDVGEIDEEVRRPNRDSGDDEDELLCHQVCGEEKVRKVG